jgi:hypothetical protein
MNSQPDGFEDLRNRMAELEKQNRRFKQLGAVVLATAAVIVVMGQAPGKKTVEANEFILKDDSGNIRARLFVTAKTTTNVTIPSLGDRPVPVTYNPRPMLSLYDEKGQATGMLDDDSITFVKSHVLLGNGVLLMGDQTAAVVVSPYNVGLSDEQGFQATLGRTSLVTPRTGEKQMTSAASLVMFDKNKNVIWKAP